jgi:hypothetical protein
VEEYEDLMRRCTLESLGNRVAAFVSSSLGAWAFLFACGGHRIPLAEPAAPLTSPTRLCGANEGLPACRGAVETEDLLRGPVALLGMADTPSGMQGAKLLTLRAHGRRGDVVLRAKWRAESTGDLLNEPRKELAAYAVQKLFLDESEYVTPPTVAYCFPVAEYARFDADAKPTFPGTDCIFGYASYWLEGVQTVNAARGSGQLGKGKGIWDAALFERDPEYRESVEDSNLLTYLINHGDAHGEQFVLQRFPRGLRAYVVDNSIAFRSIKNPMLLLRQDWSQIQVPALSRSAITRLQKLSPADFARLGNISELALSNGTLVNVRPSSPLASDGTTISWTGSRLRIGLTQGEIALVEAQTKDLLGRPDLDRLVSH